MNEKERYIIEEFKKADLTINEDQARQYLALYEFMIEYNKNVNLTSITEFADVVMKHFIDSVLPFSRLDIPDRASFIDVGTGAGFPALPLMLFRPDLKATLCDSLGKRCIYLEKVCTEIGVKAEIIHARSEELGRKRRECFDFSTARAVSAMPVLSEYCIPFVKVGGRFIALKSVNEDISTAENAINLLGSRIESISDYKLPNSDDRRVVIVKKISATPAKYPRSSANIAKKPL
ncbi:MAG: 16S rRNA (guanine(527)-N(7))-methyltransferase RsmG [Oscillospiraceae bacterium]|nr:16S rRNA (guanine(527)-N(7))-methyltransferase RsmG [Oscillospiraceae bacterium]